MMSCSFENSAIRPDEAQRNVGDGGRIRASGRFWSDEAVAQSKIASPLLFLSISSGTALLPDSDRQRDSRGLLSGWSLEIHSRAIF